MPDPPSTSKRIRFPARQLEIGETPILDKLEELRRRLVVCLAGFGMALIVSVAFSGRLFALLLGLVRASLPEEAAIIATRVPEVFLVQLRTAAVVALLASAPILLHQGYKLVRPPPLRRSGRGFLLGVIALAIGLFGIGVGFGHWVVMPHAAHFLTSFGDGRVEAMLTVSNAVSFYLRLVLAMGLGFQLPAVTLVLSRWGMLTPEFLLHHDRHAIVVVFTLAAAITPTPDLVTQSLLAIPMTLLYGLSILLSHLARPRETER